MIRRDVTRLRQRVNPLTPAQRAQWVQTTPLFTKPSVRRAPHWLLQLPQALTTEQEELLTHLGAECTEVKAVRDLMHTFRQRVQGRQAEVLPRWLEQAEQSSVTEMRSVAAGMRQEYAAVAAALAYAWRNGQVEGQRNKLKLLKRQRYGRAKLDLLQARLLHAA
jgi:transposase